jgi:hypothetical protein
MMEFSKGWLELVVHIGCIGKKIGYGKSRGDRSIAEEDAHVDYFLSLANKISSALKEFDKGRTDKGGGKFYDVRVDNCARLHR